MNGSRRKFLMAAGTAAGLGVYPGAVAGKSENRITVGEGVPALAEATAAFDREHSGVEVEMRETEGFEAFVRRETDVQHAARPMTAGERERARENGIEFEKRELPIGGIAAVAPNDGWCRCLSERQREAFDETDRVEIWSEISSDVPDDPAAADLPGQGTDVLVRGTRAHQYAIGHGGVGYYEATPAALESSDEPAGSTPVVRLGFAYVDRDAFDREAVAALVDRQAAAATDVEHVPTDGAAAN